MGQFGLVAMRAFGQRALDQMVVRPPPVAPRLGMSSLWIWHFLSLFNHEASNGPEIDFPILRSNHESFGILRLPAFRMSPGR